MRESKADISSVKKIDSEKFGTKSIAPNSQHQNSLARSSRPFCSLIFILYSCYFNINPSARLIEAYEARNLSLPILIGFRCDSASTVLESGISVIEANTPVTLTLYGRRFTNETIIAFTTEFEPDYLGNYNPKHTTHEVDYTALSQATVSSLGPSSDTITQATFTGSNSLITTESITSSHEADQLNRQPRFARPSYDCTDYNRVTSFKLNDENILSPNVAVITVILPELDAGSAGRFYYFCIKQPKFSDPGTSSISLINDSSSQNSSELYWVHQGGEWWVTLKVEPPILSIANDCILIILLLFLSAVTSGLNLGLMSLDMNELAVISSCGDQRERSYARTIAPLRRRGNYLLCSLLLGNVMVNSTLTVILEEMTSGLIAVIGSTLAIVVLGEIVPQAFCARQGLAIGAKTIYLTYAFMILTFPLSYPISRLLDCILGEEKGNVYDRERLMEFIRITGHHTQLGEDEVAIISGALKLKKIKVDQIMTRIEDVFMLPMDCRLDRDTIKQIIEKGYSRIPIYDFGDRKQIVALILAKDLALLDPDDHTPLENLIIYCKHPLIFIDDDATLDVALNEFKTGKSHMAVVRQIYDDGEVDKYYEAIGVVTLEDVIEEVLQTEINDETDILSDNRRKRRRKNAQLANHLLDELITNTSTSNFSKAAQDSADHQAAISKQIQTSLSNQLTSVAIDEVAQSLAQLPAPNFTIPPTFTGPSSSKHDQVIAPPRLNPQIGRTKQRALTLSEESGDSEPGVQGGVTNVTISSSSSPGWLTDTSEASQRSQPQSNSIASQAQSFFGRMVSLLTNSLR